MAALEITDVRVRLYNKPDDKLKAFATITLNNAFVVTDLKVIQGNTGQFVAMPSRKRRDGKFRDVAHPLNSETRQLIEERVLALYREELASNRDRPVTDTPSEFYGDYEPTTEEPAPQEEPAPREEPDPQEELAPQEEPAPREELIDE